MSRNGIGSSIREFNFLNTNNIPYRTVSTIASDTDYIKKDILKTKESLESLNSHIETTTNTFSLDNVNSLTHNYIDCINKLNFTLNCINQYSEEIIDAKSYAQVLRPIFEKKYTDNATSIDAYVFIKSAIPGKFIYFFEADSTQDDKISYTGKQAYLEPLREIIEAKWKKKFDSALKENPTQEMFYFIDFYNWSNGVKISCVIAIPNLLVVGEWIGIGAGFNLTPNMPKYTEISLLPTAYKLYLLQIETAFKKFVSVNYNPTNGTIYQFGADSDFNILKVVSSQEYPYLNGLLIKNCYIRGSNIDMPNVISRIIISLNNNFRGVQEGQIVMIDYIVGDIYYTGIIKFITVENYGLCYQIIAINKNEIFLPSVKIIGDNQIQGNFNVVNYNNESIINTDNTMKITCFNDKVGINQKPFEVKGLLDIDNLTQQTIFDIFEAFQVPSRNSYDIMRVINSLQNPSNINIPILFTQGQSLFDYANQCAVISVNIKSIIQISDLNILYNLNFGALISERTFKIIQKIIKELNQMMPDYLNANDPSFIFSFVELMPSLIQSWYFISIRGIIRNGKIITVFTRLPVTNLMVDSSYTKYLLNISDYISRLHRSINFKHLLFKNPAFYNNGVLDVIGYENYIKNNSYFSNNFDLLPESFIFNFKKNDGIYNYIASHLEWTGQDAQFCYTNTSVKSSDAVDSIKKQLTTIYDNIQENTVPVIYVYEAKKHISFVNITTLNGTECIIGAGFNIVSLLSQSLLVKGDNKINGNFFVNDWNDNVIFKVDNVEKSIINSYKVGIGTDKPEAMLDIKDTTIRDIINEMNIRAEIIKNINILTEQLKNASNEDEMRTIMSSVVSTFDNHNALFKLNMNTFKSEDTIIVFHPIHTKWIGYTFKELLTNDVDLVNNKLIQHASEHQQDLLDREMIFEDALLSTVFSHNINGYKLIAWKFILNNGQIYLSAFGTTILTSKINYGINDNAKLLYEIRKCVSRMVSSLGRRIYDSAVILNLQEGINTLNTLIQQTQNIKKSIFKIVFDITDIENLDKIIVSDIDFNTLAESNTNTLTNLSENNKLKYKNLIANTLIRFTTIKEKYYIQTISNDNNFTFFFFGLCSKVVGNQITIVFVEFCIQDVMKPSLNVEGDANISGTLFINKINLNGKILENIDGKLFWGGKEIVTK